GDLYLIKGNDNENGILCMKFIQLKKKVNYNEPKDDDIHLYYGSKSGQILLIDSEQKIIDSLKLFKKVLKSILLRYAYLQRFIYFLIQLIVLFKESKELLEKIKRFTKINSTMIQKDIQEIKVILLEKIKNYFIFIRHITEGMNQKIIIL
ncbi:hypothetical protein RFI_32295, partial [Reticulomyxa filosa]